VVSVPCALPAVGQPPLQLRETAIDLESFLGNAEHDSIDDVHFESELSTLHFESEPPTLHFESDLSTLHFESEDLDVSHLQTPNEVLPLLGCSPVDSLLSEWLNLP
jgi:hypothetical protein